MAITYTWSVVAMDCYPQYENETDVVFTCHWTLSGIDGAYSGYSYGTCGVSYAGGSSFTPYADLTQEQVVGWVKESLGEDRVAEIEASVAGEIQEKIAPTVVSLDLPWAS